MERARERYDWILPELAESTRVKIQTTVLEGLDEGVNPRKIARRIGDDFETMSDFRTRNIARTEMLSASNAGTHTAHQAAPEVEFRAWLHVRDPGNPDHRPSHFAADRRTNRNPISVDQNFAIDGFSVRHPGDFGVPRHDCMCRCTTIPAQEDGAGLGAMSRAGRKKRFVEKLTEREEQTAELVRGVFENQRRRVLEAFAAQFSVDLEAVA